MKGRLTAVIVAVVTVAVAGWWWGSGTSAPPARAQAPKGAPNVLLVVWDTTRADRLSLYGHSRPTTPWLEGFAQEAVVFERAISPEIWTPPSHASMFTGFAPAHHGVKATYKWLDGEHVTLAEHLAAHGWDTFAFSANPYLSPDTNLVQGFQEVATTFSPPWKKEARRATQAKLIPRDASTDISPAWKGKRVVGDVHPFKDAAPVAHEALAKWLEGRENPDAPWFAFVNLMEAHIPRVPSLESRRALLDEETLERGLVTPVSQIDLLAYTFGKKEYTPDEIAAINGVYDAAVLDLDKATGAMIEDLRARGLLDDTIVLLTADHGENLGDHHMFGHKFSLWDTLVRVPLVIWAPGRLEPRRVSTPVSNLSIFATILDLVGLEPPAPGPDLATSLARAIEPAPVFSDLIESTPVSISRIDRLYGIEDKAYWLRTLRSVESEGWKLILGSDGSEALYHVAEDPAELHDRAADEPERVARLAELRRAWDARVPVYDPSRRTEADAPPKVDPKARKMLQTLGYLEGGEDDDATERPAGRAER